MNKRFDVIISGGSFAGLALACALSRASDGAFSIAIVDPAQPMYASCDNDNPRAFAVAAASVNLLRTLGIWETLRGDAQAVLKIEITDTPLGAGVRNPLLSYANLTRDGDAASYIVPDRRLFRALSEAARKAAGVTYLEGRLIERQAVDPAVDTMRVGLDDAASLQAPLLVGAEGRGSPTRKRAGIGIVERDYHQDGICVQVAFERPHHATAVQHFLPGGPFAILPLPGNRACITWSEKRAVARKLLSDGETAVAEALRKRIGGRYGEITVLGAAKSWPLGSHLARRFAGERVALVADAARGVHPIAGQGLNLGFRDVAALSEILIENARLGLDIGSPEGLARYERWRRFDSTMSKSAFGALNALFSNDATPLRSLREAGLGIVDRLPFLKQAFIDEAAGLSGDVPKLLRGQAL